MPKIAYKNFRFQKRSMQMIEKANSIIDEYRKQGFDLTLRQLYYQFVARGILENTQKQYKVLGSLINDARLAGLIDWFSIVDRTRFLRGLSHWDNPGQIVESCASQFNVDKWSTQKYRPEVWIEKDALAGVFEGVCNALDVPLFSCRGYTSQSEMWSASQRLLRHIRAGQTPVILHFGDHDPSGKDMSRDITDRLEMFTSSELDFTRLALTMKQVRKYDPPPNPAKITDSRASAYIRQFGNHSWELDALEPSVLAALVRKSVNALIDKDAMLEQESIQEQHRETLRKVAKRLRKRRKV